MMADDSRPAFSKAEIAREHDRVLRANRGLVAVIEALMKDRPNPYIDVVIPISQLGAATHVEIEADNEKLIVRLTPVDT